MNANIEIGQIIVGVILIFIVIGICLLELKYAKRKRKSAKIALKNEDNENKGSKENNIDIQHYIDFFHKCRYTIEYQWIPNIVNHVNTGKLPFSALHNIHAWREDLKSRVPNDFYFEWDEMKYSIYDYDDNFVLIIYIFPKPNMVPEAIWGTVLWNKKENQGTYYTLELSYNNWVVGSMDTEGHYNYGSMEGAPKLSDFLNRVLEINKLSSTIDLSQPKNNYERNSRQFIK